MLHPLLHSQTQSYSPYTPPNNDYSIPCSTCTFPLRDEENPDEPIVAHSTSHCTNLQHPSHLICAATWIKTNNSCAECRETIDISSIVPLHERIHAKFVSIKEKLVEGALQGALVYLVTLPINFGVFFGALSTSNFLTALFLSTVCIPTGIISAALGGAIGNVVATEVANSLSLSSELKADFSKYGMFAGSNLGIIVDTAFKVSGTLITFQGLGLIALGIGGVGVAFVGTVLVARELKNHFPSFIQSEESQIIDIQ